MKSKRKTLLVQVLALLLVTVVFNTSMMPRGVMASEEENIDSFDVHPTNRWNIISGGWTTSCENSLFILNNTGDGNTDSFYLQRDLRALHGSIEFRVYVDVENTAGTTTSDALQFGLRGKASSNHIVYLNINRFRDDDTNNGAYFYYVDIDSSGQTPGATDVSFQDETWYRFRIDYDIPRSKLRYRMYGDDGTEIADYEEDWIFQYGQPIYAAIQALYFEIKLSCRNSGETYLAYVDYVKAPFKEREWEQTTSPGDADWLEDTWHGAYVQDTVDAVSAWQLVVPYLDSFSGQAILEYENVSVLSNGDECGVYVGLYGVDADDGDTHVIAQAAIAKVKESGDTKSVFEAKINGSSELVIENIDDNFPKMSFSFSLSEDRSVYSFKARYWPDVTNTTGYTDYIFEGDVSDSVNDPSQEFIIEIRYDIDLSSDTEFTCLIEDFGLQERDIFSDIVDAIVQPVGNFLAAIFTAGFRFIAGIFKFIGDAITSAITTLQTALAALLSAISATLTSMGIDVTSILTNVANLATDFASFLASFASDIADAIWAAAESALSFITDSIEAIWTTLEPVISDIVSWITAAASDVADLVFAVIEYLITLLLTIAIDLFELAAAIIFAAWDALGLPDLLAVLDFLTAGFVQLVTDGLAGLEWLKDVTTFWGWGVMFIGLVIFWMIPVLRSKGDFGEFAESFYTMNSWNIIPFSILGFEAHVPVGVIYWPVFFLFLAASTAV